MKKLILCFVVVMLSALGAMAQTKNGGISEDMLGRIRQGYTGTPEQKAVKNALASNSIATLAVNAENLSMCDTHFSHRVSTKGITNQSENAVLVVIVLVLLFIVNAGYGGGFSNVPTLLSDHYGMQNISAIHGIVLSAWAVAGLTGNQVATLIVNNVGKFVDDGHGNMINPDGYQAVLYLTVALYIVALLVSFFMVDHKKKSKVAEQ